MPQISYSQKHSTACKNSVQSDLANSTLPICYPSKLQTDLSSLDPHLTHGSLDPRKSAPQVASQFSYPWHSGFCAPLLCAL